MRPTGKSFRFVSCVRASGRGEAKLCAGVRRCASQWLGFSTTESPPRARARTAAHGLPPGTVVPKLSVAFPGLSVAFLLLSRCFRLFCVACRGFPMLSDAFRCFRLLPGCNLVHRCGWSRSWSYFAVSHGAGGHPAGAWSRRWSYFPVSPGAGRGCVVTARVRGHGAGGHGAGRIFP